MKDFIIDHINQQYEEREEAYRGILRAFVDPPIKGEVTSAKLRYREIFLNTNPSTAESWITQRGRQIGPTFHKTIHGEFPIPLAS